MRRIDILMATLKVERVTYEGLMRDYISATKREKQLRNMIAKARSMMRWAGATSTHAYRALDGRKVR